MPDRQTRTPPHALSPKYVAHPPPPRTSVVVEVVFRAPDLVTDGPSERFDAPEPPDEHAANRHTDAREHNHPAKSVHHHWSTRYVAQACLDAPRGRFHQGGSHNAHGTESTRPHDPPADTHRSADVRSARRRPSERSVRRLCSAGGRVIARRSRDLCPAFLVCGRSGGTVRWTQMGHNGDARPGSPLGKHTTGVYTTADKAPISRLATAPTVPRRCNATVPASVTRSTPTRRRHPALSFRGPGGQTGTTPKASVAGSAP